MLDIKYLKIMRLGAIALFAAALTACGGGDSTTPTPPPPVDGAVSIDPALVKPLTEDPNSAFTAIKGSVVQSTSPTRVYFTVTNSAGQPVQGLTLNGQAGLCGTNNIRVAVAKLIKSSYVDLNTGNKPEPDAWQNLITRIRPPAVNPSGFKEGTTDPTPTATNTTDGVGSLTYNSAGYYVYTFGTDITNPAYSSTTAAPTSGTITTDGNALNKDGTTTYRVGLQICFEDSTGKMVNVNPWYDFTMGSTGLSSPVTDPAKTHKVVDRTSCNTCHAALDMHGGRRVDPNFCVLCHNPGSVDYHDKNLAALGYPDGGAPIDMKYFIHKTHRGELLTKDYEVADLVARHDTLIQLAGGGTIVEGTQYSQDQRNCTTCHDNTKATDADNWKNKPSRAACGACHDGIDFATGGGYTIDPDVAWHTVGHLGGAQANDRQCATCHSADAIDKVYHQPITAITSTSTSTLGQVTYYASNDNRLPAGAVTVDYDIQSVSKNGAGNPVMVFRILQNGARMDLRTASNTSDRAIWPNFDNAPSIYFAYSIPQDGIAAPADFNVYVNTSLLGIWNGSGTTTNAGTLTGPDANGYYTVTLTGRTIPANANMLTGALGYAAMYQTNVSGYTRTCASPTSLNCSLGLNVTAQDVKKAANPLNARRITTDPEACNACHGKLGIFAESVFHSGQRNDPTMCAMCHNPNRTSSGWSADSTAFVHGIHGGQKRTVPYNWHAVTGLLVDGVTPVRTKDFATILFPGGLNHLKTCTACHEPGGYDFSAGASQVANRLYRVSASGTMAAAGTSGALSLSPYVTPGATYGTGYNSSTAAPSGTEGTSLVNSPIANACFACHDGDLAASPGTSVKDHIEAMGIGSIYKTRTEALGRSEQCLLCHGPNANIAPIKAAHGID
jgi:OmcA/MtrC family decaheme c-type cytochrome